MLKRALWLLSFVLLGWAVWRWWQDRTSDVFEATPQLASSVPPPDYTNPSAPAPPAPQEPPQPEPPAASLAAPPADTGPEGSPDRAAPDPDDELANPLVEAGVALEVPVRPAKELAVGAPAQEDSQSAEDPAAPAAPAETAEGSQTAEETADAEPDEAEDESDGVITGYCVRCKTKRDMVDPQLETTENGRRAARGTCPVCEGTMFTFLKERAPGA